jgi:transposase
MSVATGANPRKTVVGCGVTAKRWRVERLFAWLHHFRRVVTRWEYHIENFLSLVRLGRIKLLLRQ